MGILDIILAIFLWKFEINSNQKVQNLAKENDFFFFNEKSVHLTALSSCTG